MFGIDFYPTPPEVIAEMLQGRDLQGLNILEPSAGKGNIVEYLIEQGANVQACEIDGNLRAILSGKCSILCNDFLTLKTEQVSHLQMIVMNPPFSKQEEHILHAYEIAPAGCQIVSLCNDSMIKNVYSEGRKQVKTLIEENGYFIELGKCFDKSERATMVEVSCVYITKPGQTENETDDFTGFNMDEEVEEPQEIGLQSYSYIREIVNRYKEAMKIYDEQAAAAVRMNNVLKGYYHSELCMMITELGVAKSKNEFRISLQNTLWKTIFSKLNMEKITTQGLRSDINKFLNRQAQAPFTQANIYKMLEIVIGTTEARMNKAMEIIFDRVCERAPENKFAPETWKTNSHYLLNRKFIIPHMCATDKRNNGPKLNDAYGANFDFMEDFLKALCWITGDNYDTFLSLSNHVRCDYKIIKNGRPIYAEHEHNRCAWKTEAGKEFEGCEIVHNKIVYGEEFQWAFFTVKAFKKGTMHFTFTDEKLWETFNQRIAKIKGYPLFSHSNRQKAEPQPKPQQSAPTKEPVILKTYKIKTA